LEDELAKFLVRLPRRAAANGQDMFHDGVEQALSQDSLADHPRCAEENDFHGCVISPFLCCPGACLRVTGSASPRAGKVSLLRPLIVISTRGRTLMVFLVVAEEHS